MPAPNTSNAAVAASVADLGGTSLVPAAGAATPSAASALCLTCAPYCCTAVLEPPRPTCCKHLAVSAGGRYVAASHAEHVEYDSSYQLVYCERWDLNQLTSSAEDNPKPLQEIWKRSRKHWGYYPLSISECGQRVLTMTIFDDEWEDQPPALSMLYVCDESERGKAVRDRGCGNHGCRVLDIDSTPGRKAVVRGEETSAEDGHEEEEEKEEQGDCDEELWVSSMALTASGRYAAAMVHSSTIAVHRTWLSVWDLDPAEFRPHHGFSPLASIRLDVSAISTAISPDGSCVTAITGCTENNTPHRVCRWQVGSGELSGPVQLQGDVGSFDQSAMSSDGPTAVAFKDSKVQVWDLTTGALTATLEGHGMQQSQTRSPLLLPTPSPALPSLLTATVQPLAAGVVLSTCGT